MKRLLSVLLAAVMLLTCIPLGAIPVFAAAKDDRNIILGGNNGITRAEWLHNLVYVFDMTVEEEALPDNYFADLDESHEYYEDILLAVEFGVVNVEAGGELGPDLVTTRDFAASTLNFCLGYQLGDEQEYTYFDYALCADPAAAQVALNRGWIALVDGCFAPARALTSAEAETMLDDATQVLEGQIVDENYESTYTFVEDAIVIPDGTLVEEDTDGKVRIIDCPESILVDDIVAVYFNGIPSVYRTTAVEFEDNVTVLSVETVSADEAFISLDAQGVLDSEAMEIIPAEGVDVALEEDVSSTFATKKVRNISAEIPLKFGAVTGKVSVKIKNPYVDYAVSGDRVYVALCGETTLSYSISANVGLENGFTLFTCSIAGIGSFDVAVMVDLSGTASGNVKGYLVAGIEAQKDQGIRAVKNFTQSQYYTNVEAEASVSLKATLGVTKMPVISAYVYAEVGVKANFSKKHYLDDKKPEYCTHFAAYLFARYGASASAQFGMFKTSESLDYDIYDEDNSPVRIVNHYEDGMLVPKCTRGNTYANFFTKRTSRWSGSGWISANGAYALNEDGTYYPLYNYTLNDKNEATITKYNGNSWSVYIPKEIDGCTVVAIGNNAFQYKDVGYVVIPDTVVNIKFGAFNSCEHLRSITIPDSVTDIDSNAFQYCVSLESIKLPAALEYVQGRVFEGCLSLKSIVIPDAVIEIHDSAFARCSSLETVTLSKNVTHLGCDAFAETALKTIEIPKSLDGCSMSWYNSEDGSADGPFRGCVQLENITFEKGVTQIPSRLMAGCTGLKKVTIPDTVTEIERWAFYGCPLEEVTIGSSVTVIGSDAFSCCRELVDIVIPNSVTDIGDSAFARCSSLETVTLSKNVTHLGCEAFAETALKTIEIPKSLDACSMSWYNSGDGSADGPFRGCVQLENITFEKGVTQIPSRLMAGCPGLKKVTIPDTVTEIESWAFYGCPLEEVTIGSSVTVIGSDAFSCCRKLVDIVIPNSVTDIGDSAFVRCSSLETVTLSKNVTHLGCDAFAETALKTIEIPKSLDGCSMSWYNSGDGSADGPFRGCVQLENITFEKGVTQIPSRLMAGCSGLKKVTIPDTVTEIESFAFYGCPLEEVTIGSSVTVIGSNAFACCRKLVDIVIPDSVISMGDACFAACSALESVVLSNTLTEIADYAFRNCLSLKTIDFPLALESIGQYAFDNCTSLENFTFSKGSNVENIGSYSFQGCTNLKEAVLPETVTVIGWNAFWGCVALEKVSIPQSTKTIGSSAFMGCVALEKVSIPQSTKTIGSSAFMGCESLKDVTIADYSIETLNSQVFKNCPALERITLPKGLINIKGQVFMNDTGLTDVVIPESVTSIDSTAFSYPDKTVIYGKSGSYAETFAKDNGFKFENNYVPAEGFGLLDGVEYIVLDRGESYRAQFEFYPENATDVITLTANNSNVTINGLDIYARYTGDTVVTATTSGGVTYEFTVHIRDARNIAIVTPPTKTQYVMGEELDLTGMEVQVNYGDGTSRMVTDYTVFGFDSSVEGECTVTVQWISAYGSKYTTTFTVTVVDPRPKLTGIYIATLPTKVEYARKESLDLTGLVVKATYTDGAEQVVTDYTVSGYNALKNGEQTITVTFGEYTATFTVTVGQVHQHTYDNACDADCNGCGAVREVGSHTYTSEVTSTATCTEQGVRTFTCSSCGDTYTEVIPVLGHTPGAVADCDNAQTCTVCGAELVAALGHDYTAVVTAPDCVNNGYTTHTCVRCGDSYVDSDVSATGHTYVGKETTAPTCAEEGIETYTCSACGDTYTETIPATGEHIYDNGCDSICNVCDYTREVNDHIYDDDSDTDCNECGAVREIVVIPGDINDDGKVNVRDLGLLQQYINGWDVVVAVEVADVTGDGKVNVRDLGLLQQFINGWDVVLK